MIVPRFWAEARRQQPRGQGRAQITVRRFGWSDTSEADAQRMAEERAQAAFQKAIAGEKLPRREPRVAYNGAEGVPIREEVLARHGDVVITRNAYGAQCLNTPDVLFADIDFNEAPGCRSILLHGAVLIGVALGAAGWLQSLKLGLVFTVAAVFFTLPLTTLTRKLVRALRGGPERIARARLESYVRSHGDWRLQLYRTPAGFRVLAMHEVFDPRSEKVAKFFKALAVDPVYAAMCRNQHCFRARVSPKPWRVGLGGHLRPRPGVWPVKPEHLPRRRDWVRDYEAKAANFASCRFVETIGRGATHAKAEAVRALHDEMCRALSGREIA